MTLIVVDASIAVKWLIDEGDQERAIAIGKLGDLIAPDIISLEVANALWAKVRAKKISRSHADDLFATLMHWPMTFASSVRLAERARSLSFELDAAIYDCLYWALALEQSAALATADLAFIAKLRRKRVPASRIILL